MFPEPRRARGSQLKRDSLGTIDWESIFMDSYFGSRFSPKGMPLLLWIGMYWCGLISCYIFLACFLLLFGVQLSGFSIDYTPVTSAEFFSDPRGMAFIPIALLLSMVAYALFTRRYWSRALIFGASVAFWVLILLAAALGKAAWLDAAVTVLMPVMIGWYLYISTGAVRYYRMLLEPVGAQGAGA